MTSGLLAGHRGSLDARQQRGLGRGLLRSQACGWSSTFSPRVAWNRGAGGAGAKPLPSTSQSTVRRTLSARTHTRFKGGSLAALGWGRLDDTALRGRPSLALESTGSAGLGGGRGFVFTSPGGTATALLSVGGDWLSAPGDRPLLVGLARWWETSCSSWTRTSLS